MKKFGLIILTSLITIVLCGQNISVDRYPLNYNINNATITDSTVVFSGGLIVNVDSTLTISFNSPARCSQVRLFGASWIGDYRHVSMFTNIDHSSATSESGGIGYYGMAGNGFNFYDQANSEFNITAFSLIVVSGQYTIDSIRFTIDNSIETISQYTLGWYDGYADGYDIGEASADTISPFNNGVLLGVDIGVASVDTVTPFNNGVASVDTDAIFDAGVASVDTDVIYNNGYTAGAASVDTDAIYNNGVAYGLSQCDAPVDTISIWNNGYMAGSGSINTDAIYDDGYAAGVGSINTDAIYNNGYTAGVASVDTDAIFDAGVASVDTDAIFDAGVASVDTDAIFDAGVASVDTVTPFNNGVLSGYNAGLTDCQTTGVDESTLDDISVYPNPTSDWVNINVDNYESVGIYNMMGSLLETSTESSVSLVDYNIGTYFFRVYTSEGEVAVIKVLRK